MKKSESVLNSNPRLGKVVCQGHFSTVYEDNAEPGCLIKVYHHLEDPRLAQWRAIKEEWCATEKEGKVLHSAFKGRLFIDEAQGFLYFQRQASFDRKRDDEQAGENTIDYGLSY